MKWFGTARVRTGIVVDNVLLYATGGLAYANFNRNEHRLLVGTRGIDAREESPPEETSETQ